MTSDESVLERVSSSSHEVVVIYGTTAADSSSSPLHSSMSPSSLTASIQQSPAQHQHPAIKTFTVGQDGALESKSEFPTSDNKFSHLQTTPTHCVHMTVCSSDLFEFRRSVCYALDILSELFHVCVRRLIFGCDQSVSVDTIMTQSAPTSTISLGSLHKSSFSALFFCLPLAVKLHDNVRISTKR